MPNIKPVPPRVPMTDPRTGVIAREWYQFLTDQSSAVGGAPLSRVNDCNVTLTLGGSPIVALLSATSLTLGWVGQLSIGRGGTGASTVEGARDALGAAPLDSPAFTGTPTAPTASGGTNTGQVATTEFVQTAITGLGDKSYVYEQIANSSNWNISHNLGKKPSVTIVDSGGTVLFGELSYVDDNNLTVTFSLPVNGKAYLN